MLEYGDNGDSFLTVIDSFSGERQMLYGFNSSMKATGYVINIIF